MLQYRNKIVSLRKRTKGVSVCIFVSESDRNKRPIVGITFYGLLGRGILLILFTDVSAQPSEAIFSLKNDLVIGKVFANSPWY